MKSFSSRLILLLNIGFILVVGYNGCSDVAFNATSSSSAVRIASTSALMINNGAPYTNDPTLNVTLTLIDEAASEMYVTNDPTCQAGGTWQPYAKTLPWKLQTPNSQDAVYANYRDGGVTSGCVKATILHDDIPPVVVVPTPVQYTNKTNLDLSIQASDSGSGVSNVLCATDSKPQSDCAAGYSAASLTEGAHLVQVNATDKAGNNSLPVSQSWIVDLTPPVVTINSKPAAVTAATQAPFVISATDNLSPIAGYTCTLDTGSAAACPGTTFSLTVGAGSHTLAVQATDAAGNTSAPVSYTWTVDLSVPSVTFTKTPSPLSNDPNPAFGFTGTDNGQPVTTFKCRLNGGTYVPCTSPDTVGPIGEGSNTFSVEAVNAVGTASAPITFTWTADFTPPVITLTMVPDPRTNQTSTTIAFTTTDNSNGAVTTVCKLDSGAYGACVNSVNLTSLPEGSHTFSVVATDQAGNSSAPTVVTWVIDLAPPTIQITAGPANPTNQTNANFTLVANDPNGGAVAALQCKMDSAPTYSSCTSLPKYTGLTPGDHTFYARAVDSVGNISQPATWPWTIDTNSPVITFQQVPLNPTPGGQPAVVQYTVTDPVTPASQLVVTCGFDGKSATCPAASTQTLAAPQSAGSHSFTITATNTAGNTSTKTITWTALPILQYPALNSMAAIAFEDMYPQPGDADYNDFVSGFKITEAVNSSNQVTKIDIDFYPRAAGAGYDSQLLIVLSGKKQQPSNVTVTTSPLYSGTANVTLTRYNANGQLTGTTANVDASKDIVIFPSTHALFGNGQMAGSQLNSTPSQPYYAANQAARLEIVLNSPASNPVPTTGMVDISKFRMMLHVIDTNQDIDIIDVVPTNFDTNGYPFGFVIPTAWQWPTETTQIDSVYPNFSKYRSYLLAKAITPSISTTADVLNWFNYPVQNSTKLYPMPAAPTLLPNP